MENLLVTIRDFLLALALAWVGVSIERPQATHPAVQPPAQHEQQATSTTTATVIAPR